MDLQLENHCILITGGTDGIGLALAKNLINEGAKVAVCGRDEGRLENARKSLGENSLCFRADVTKNPDIEAFIDASISKFGRINGLVNNAGRASSIRLADSTDADWQDDFDLKILSTVRAIRYATPHLEKSNGAIINTLSNSARAPGAGSTPTSATRAAGLTLTKTLANELGPKGIRVNALLVGFVASGQWARRAEAEGIPEQDYYIKAAEKLPIPLGRYGRSEEFADIATYLLSPRASYITGVGISVDGGLSPVI
jgi:NAD(P)-dependent dehydrogenase (short-subunit alcohol dehydrogenase family)